MKTSNFCTAANIATLAIVTASITLPAIEVEAAEVMMPTTVRPVPYFGTPQSFPRWSGWYVGGTVGTDTFKLDNDVFGRGRWGVSGQVFAGYDWQFRAIGQTFVVGGLGDFAFYSSAKASVSPNFALAGWDGYVKQTWSGDVGVRAGWAVMPKLLVYVSAGASFGWTEATLRNEWLNTVTTSDSSGLGWFGGIGAEAEVMRHMSVRGEYRFGQIDLSGSTLTTQRAMIGVAYRR